MGWVSLAAVFFIVWWIVLFAILPVSLRTQDDEGEVTLGTPGSAPKGPHVLRAMFRTTVVTAIILAVYLLATRYFGIGWDDLPRIGPRIGPPG